MHLFAIKLTNLENLGEWPCMTALAASPPRPGRQSPALFIDR